MREPVHPARDAAKPAAPHKPTRPGPPAGDGMLRLQALAGNNATARLVEGASPATAPGRAQVIGQSPAAALGEWLSLQRVPAGATTVAPGQAIDIVFAREDGLNLRETVDTASRSLATLRFGTRLHVLEDEKQHPTWLKVATASGTGFVAANRTLAPPPAKIQQDPALTLIRVKRGQTFWGLVREQYGIRGNEGTADQNVNHFINAIRAVNEPTAFIVETDVLDDLGNATVPGRDASDTLLIENTDLWIPSFPVAAAMDVGSGTVTGEVARLVKKVEQKIADFRAAGMAAGDHIPGAVARHAGDVGQGLIEGLIDFAIEAAGVLVLSTAAGALIGSLAGGVGAIPGAEIGFELGLMILEYYGLAVLIEMVLSMAGSLVSHLGQFISQVWAANGDPKKIDQAGKSLAEALGILVSAVLMALVLYLTHRGVKALSSTRFAQKVGQNRIAVWLADRQKAKTTTETGKPEKPKERTEERAPERTEEPEQAPKEPVKDYVACFLAGTLVVTGRGAVAIESVTCQDTACTRSPGTGSSPDPVTPHEVSNTFSGSTSRVRQITIGDDLILATPGHRFSVLGQGWTAARDLVPGSLLETGPGPGVRVGAVQDISYPGARTTYNLTVPATSTYLIRVGGQDVLVHNGNAPPPLPDFNRVLYWVFGNKATVRPTDTDGMSMWKTTSRADVDKLMEARVKGDGRSVTDPHAFFEPEALDKARIAVPETPGRGTKVVETGLTHHSARPIENPDPKIALDAEAQKVLQERLNSAGKPTVVKPKALTCG